MASFSNALYCIRHEYRPHTSSEWARKFWQQTIQLVILEVLELCQLVVRHHVKCVAELNIKRLEMKTPILLMLFPVINFAFKEPLCFLRHAAGALAAFLLQRFKGVLACR